MAMIIDGKAVSAATREAIKNEVAELKEKGVTPGLAVIIVGDDPASRVYVNNKKKACADLGMLSEEYALPAETTNEELLGLINELNGRKDINVFKGIVEEPVYTGFQSKFYVRLENGTIVKVFKQHTNYLDDGPEISWKDTVYISWSAEDGYIVEDINK